MNGPDWNKLRSFMHVAQHGSIAGAAQNTLFTQPTLSRHVRELEAELGLQLFSRSKAGVTLTKAGTAIYETSLAMFQAAQTVASIAEGQNQQLEGVVRVSSSLNVAHNLLPGIITRILTDHPDLEIELVASDGVENLLQRDADIAVRMFRPAQQDLIAKRLGELEVGMYVAPRYLEKRGRPETTQDLMQHDFVGYDRLNLSPRGFREAGLPVNREFFRFRCDDESVGWSLVKAGFGIGFAPVLFAERDQEVVRLFEHTVLRKLPIWLVAHADLLTSAKIRLVYDQIASSIQASLDAAQAKDGAASPVLD